MSTETDTPTIHNPQLRRAYALARAHGHAWASAIEEHVEGGGSPPRTWAQADEIDRGADHGPMGGILCPMPTHAEGSVRHTTATGRTEWVVGPCGRTEIRVTRPGGRVVASATVAPDGRTTLEGLGAYGRHTDALCLCLMALSAADYQAEQADLEQAAREAVAARGDGGLLPPQTAPGVLRWMDANGWLIGGDGPPRCNRWAVERAAD